MYQNDRNKDINLNTNTNTIITIIYDKDQHPCIFIKFINLIGNHPQSPLAWSLSSFIDTICFRLHILKGLLECREWKERQNQHHLTVTHSSKDTIIQPQIYNPSTHSHLLQIHSHSTASVFWTRNILRKPSMEGTYTTILCGFYYCIWDLLFIRDLVIITSRHRSHGQKVMKLNIINGMRAFNAELGWEEETLFGSSVWWWCAINIFGSDQNKRQFNNKK